ncbi:unnamed protein product [Paramecium sonneborni]|uniref:Uncharacterized protein n=1 Tax=Paramecium sonneborni TaxID=65129 RepID=A0A8S1KMZ3_9CILI|nr:unnamed protein product [Paramecium sonneborni]
MLDYIPFTKGQENEIKLSSGTGGAQSSILKNQKYTLKFLQNKQNYAKINKVTDYQSLLNSPEQITTRSLDIQQYEYFLRKDGLDNRQKEYKISKGQQTTLTRKQLQQQIKVENVHLNENSDQHKKLEFALNRSKFNRVGSFGESYRSQDSLSSIQKITRYQQQQQQNQYLQLQQQEEQNIQKSNQEDQSLSSIKVEEQIVDISSEKHEEIVQNDQIENENIINQQSEQQVDVQEQLQPQQINESYVLSQFSVPQQYSINNEISLINYEEDADLEEEEVEEQIQSGKKQVKNQKQKRQKAKKQQNQQQQQSNSKVNQSIQSVKKSDGIKSNKISRQQSQMSISDLDRIEQIIQQNANDLDEAEEIQRDKMRKQIRELEERIQKTKERQEQFQYHPEDYQDMSGEYLQVKKKEQQSQQEQQQQQHQQQYTQPQQQQQQNQINTPKKQGKVEIRPHVQTQQIISKQVKQIKVSEIQSQAVLPNVNQQQKVQEHPMTAKSTVQENMTEIEKTRISQHSIELEKSVVLSLKDLEQKQQNHPVTLGSDPMIKIENKLKQIQEDMENQSNKKNDLDFADFLLTSTNVFDTNYQKYKIFQVDKKLDDPPGHFAEEDKNLFQQMKYWDAQNTGNSKKIQAVADLIRGICTKLTSDANISEPNIKTQKSIDSDWD